MEETTIVEAVTVAAQATPGALLELSYALDTFYFLITGALVMWMAAGFAMLEAGLVRSKSTVEILTKNIALYSTACVMYMIMGVRISAEEEYEGSEPVRVWNGGLS